VLHRDSWSCFHQARMKQGPIGPHDSQNGTAGGAENRLQRDIRAGWTWLSGMGPGNFAAPAERRSVLSAVSDWIPEASETGQQTVAPNENPAPTPGNSDGKGESRHR
jgi:hypothetical protein